MIVIARVFGKTARTLLSCHVISIHRVGEHVATLRQMPRAQQANQRGRPRFACLNLMQSLFYLCRTFRYGSSITAFSYFLSLCRLKNAPAERKCPLNFVPCLSPWPLLQ